MRESEIQKIRRTGKRMLTAHFDVRASDSLFPHGRIGIIVPKFGKTVVERNRLRRQLREIGRTVLLPGLGPLDVLVKALPSAYGMDFTGLNEAIASVAQDLPRIS